MKTVGIIAEYNPFHNGHEYHISEAKRITDADFCVVVMSGNYVQRGAPAIVNKYLRTQMALQCGADLVLELPVRYATGSAEYFARGAISILDNLGIIDFVCFGSECGNIQILNQAGEFFARESEELSSAIRRYTSSGLSYPAAREQAFKDCCENFTESPLVFSPNNILAIEYCKALHQCRSTITPVTIKRQGSEYHQEELVPSLSSASAIRRQIYDGLVDPLKNQIPQNAYEIIAPFLTSDEIVSLDDFSLLLKYKLQEETIDSLSSYQDVSNDLANKIWNQRYQFHTITDFIEQLKSKNLTYTRISRALLHILLNIKKAPANHQTFLPYARILGFKKTSSQLFSEIKQHNQISLVSKLANYTSILEGYALSLIEEDIWCSNLYESIVSHKTQRPFIHEFSRPVVII